MKFNFLKASRSISAFAAVVLVLSACTEESIIFRDRELFNPPPDSVSGFVGYADNLEGLTVCGNCHATIQASWENTVHADAYNGLVGSGHAQDFCFNCHTVSHLGNAEAGPAGHAVVQDSAYFDVQCESCHGPGADHIANPELLQPVPSIAVSTTDGCGECHTGNHHPFVDEWLQSPHAQPVGYVIGRAAGNPDDECLTCHTGQGRLRAWWEDQTYVEADDPVDDWLGITCAVCHDPHGSPNEGQLRFSIEDPNIEANLCMQCHHKRAQPDLSSSTLRGPHSPEGPLLLGEGAGWIPTGAAIETDRIRSSHGDVGNSRTCATCHVASYDVNDSETGAFLFTATGHLFLAIPCTDAQGIPVPDGTCTVAERSFEGCATSGCHPSADGARNLYVLTTARIAALVAEVDSLVNLAPAGQRDSQDGVFTVADGAWFNARLGELPGSAIHNPFFIEQLLAATIVAVKAEYNL